ncbi:MAG: tRNA (guanosine(37)-N1)-methyltransferase TrmD [Calditrichaeota bacterium]|nr:tRNA (guanosine(37)-N1)-methyltransferase TrmD [Candidatus Cloacimonadota bacterium]MCA9787519.1 tRNA (guanosine(37)-N1)-methyltransferase TrmD [Candidatus Cloacimonadota bacterium]MCB1047304.1 tRNA (guanosine(37)-N1)-methyltransferase TrmD [Calditrichota bacterium]MCB9473007.1 tRNA (guanosine(37)-N1)-methyltransferase TrmD [Candidatus Delongbacteria bacterium]
MVIEIITLFPEMFRGPLDESIVVRARRAGLVDIRVHDLRDWTDGPHRKADDDPFGDGAGMVMKAEPLIRCVTELKSKATLPVTVVLLSPQGPLWKQEQARVMAREESHLLLVCGHYKGVDERFIERCVDREISIGDYILSGGELGAMVLVDSLVRLLPGAIGRAESAGTDSLEDGLLDAPQYTRPAEFEGMAVPEVLLSGHHARIESWRAEQRRQRTREKRPDLFRLFEEKLNKTQ